METKLTLEFWIDDLWYVGRLKEIPGIFSQGETLAELEENIIDAYKMIMEDMKDEIIPVTNTNTKEIRVEF
jgi:predicted RNase H-like HicB family nuclease